LLLVSGIAGEAGFDFGPTGGSPAVPCSATADGRLLPAVGETPAPPAAAGLRTSNGSLPATAGAALHRSIGHQLCGALRLSFGCLWPATRGSAGRQSGKRGHRAVTPAGTAPARLCPMEMLQATFGEGVITL